MRGFYLSLLTAALSSGSLLSQYYTTSAFTAPYAPLEEPFILDLGAGWDDPEMMIPVGFDFPVFGTPTSQLLLTGVGEMLMAPSLDGMMDFLFPTSLDVCDVSPIEPGSLSRIQHLTTGNAPNRICKIEWSNVGFYNEVYGPGTAIQRANYQVWLYESDGAIEFRFGPNTVLDAVALADGFFSSGVIENYDYDYNGMFQIGNGDPAVGSFSYYTNLMEFVYGGAGWTGMPANGQVYRFANPSASIASAPVQEGVRMYPNPVRDVLTLQVPQGAEGARWMRALDAMGREVHAALLQPGTQAQWEVGAWPAGWYTLTDGAGTVERICVQ